MPLGDGLLVGVAGTMGLWSCILTEAGMVTIVAGGWDLVNRHDGGHYDGDRLVGWKRTVG